MPRPPEYKPLLYTTTVRNPERYKDFIHLLKRFDGQILTTDIVEQFEHECFKCGLYRPVKRIPESARQKWGNTSTGDFGEYALTSEETKAIFDGNDPRIHLDIKGHKEAGFERGWESRFDTQFKLLKVLGFVYYKMGEPIVFSEIGNFLADSVEITYGSDGTVNREIVNPQNEQAAFMQAFAKQQCCNPFIRELNDNIPLILLLQVIRLLNRDPEYNNCGISYKEIPLILFWKDNDANALYQRIKKLRQEYGYTPSPEVINEICVDEILGGFKAFKLKSVVSEYPDDFVRKMRMTGLISFRGGGRFIDINHNEDEKIDYIISTYSHYVKYESERAYFDYMSTADERLLSIEGVTVSRNEAADKLAEWTQVYNWNSIKIELDHLAKRTSSKDDTLKFIDAPSRLEFLTALAIKTKLPHVEVIPNYPIDDTGLPTSTAGGGIGDIECIETPNAVLVEVTMAQGRTQTMMEVWPIERHLEEFKEKYNAPSQCVFIAPSIFNDTERQIAFVKFTKGLTIRPYRIADFINFIESSECLFNNN